MSKHPWVCKIYKEIAIPAVWSYLIRISMFSNLYTWFQLHSKVRQKSSLSLVALENLCSQNCEKWAKAVHFLHRANLRSNPQYACYLQAVTWWGFDQSINHPCYLVVNLWWSEEMSNTQQPPKQFQGQRMVCQFAKAVRTVSIGVSLLCISRNSCFPTCLAVRQQNKTVNTELSIIHSRWTW